MIRVSQSGAGGRGRLYSPRSRGGSSWGGLNLPWPRGLGSSSAQRLGCGNGSWGSGSGFGSSPTRRSGLGNGSCGSGSGFDFVRSDSPFQGWRVGFSGERLGFSLGRLSIVVVGRCFDVVLIVLAGAVRLILATVVGDGACRFEADFALLDSLRGLDARVADFGGDLAFGAAFAVDFFALLSFFCADEAFDVSFFLPAAVTGDDKMKQHDTAITITREVGFLLLV